MEPYFRAHKTPVFKSDHPSLSYKQQGHLLHPKREEFIERQRARVYTQWEPPSAGAPREGKKIVDLNRPKNDGRVEAELD